MTGPNEQTDLDLDALKDAWTEADRADMHALIERAEQILEDVEDYERTYSEE